MTTSTADSHPPLSSNPFAAPESMLHELEPVKVLGPILFPTSVAKWVIMNVFTFNLYSVVWFYKNWNYIHRTRGVGRPALYAVLNIFSVFSLCKWVATEAEERKIQRTWILQILALLYLLAATFSLMGDRLEGPASLVGLLGLFMSLPLVPVQQTINEINAKDRPGVQINSRFSPLNVIFLAVYGVLVLYATVNGLLKGLALG